jgi:hypothetical protein
MACTQIDARLSIVKTAAALKVHCSRKQIEFHAQFVAVVAGTEVDFD